jgi:phosphoribosylaminoimidazole carboxylase/phosphoribosylaminoimidazole-succinocarboxamide synthase
MGSPTDLPHCEKIKKECVGLGIPVFLIVSSAHKTTRKTLDIIAQYEGKDCTSVYRKDRESKSFGKGKAFIAPCLPIL